MSLPYRKAASALFLLLIFVFPFAATPIQAGCSGSCGSDCSYSVFKADVDSDGDSDTVVVTVSDGEIDIETANDDSWVDRIC
jgi:hypothetical protein